MDEFSNSEQPNGDSAIYVDSSMWFSDFPFKKTSILGTPFMDHLSFRKKNCDHMDDDALEAPLAAKWGW